MKSFLKLTLNLFAILFVVLFANHVKASQIPQEYLKKIELKDRIYKIEIDTAKYHDFFDIYTKYYYKNQEIKFASGSNIFGYLAFAYEDVESREVWGISRGAIENYIRKELIPKYDRKMQSVRIFRNTKTDEIEFEGFAVNGRKINVNKLTNLIVYAIENQVNTLIIPFDYEPAKLTIEDKELEKQGIQALIATGESDFSVSSWARKTNIRVGMASFNGKLLEKNSIFSIANELGKITVAKGYKAELVIKHDGTVPELGGGLCQVSTTAFRGALQAGFEIVERWNHAYAISHYEPYGTDATIYPPSKDFKFKNNTMGAILIQTYLDEENEIAYVNYFGTKDDREVNIFGPYVSHWKYPNTKKIETDPNKQQTQKYILHNFLNGFNVYWKRVVKDSSEIKLNQGSGSTTLYMTGSSLPIYEFISIYKPASLFPLN